MTLTGTNVDTMLLNSRRTLRAVGMIALTLLLAAVASWTSGQSSDRGPPPSVLAGPTLLQALQRGGYILYFRHTSTDFGQNDDRMTGYEDCARQRNLTEAGRAEARLIGAAIRDLRIPIGDVLASPFCRTRETAELIFGRAQVSDAVRGGPAQAETERYAELRSLLAHPVQRGVNVAIASHGNPFVAVAGAPYLAEGEAAVVEPRGADGFRVVARIRKDEWMRLGRP